MGKLIILSFVVLAAFLMGIAVGYGLHEGVSGPKVECPQGWTCKGTITPPADEAPAKGGGR